MIDLSAIKTFLVNETAKLNVLKETYHDYELASSDYEAYKEFCSFFNKEPKPIAVLEENLKIAYYYYFK